jgi:CysZ protein
LGSIGDFLNQIKNTIVTFSEMWKVYKSDKVIVGLSFIPLIIGSFFYYFVGAWFYSTLLSKGKELIEAQISSSGLGTFIYYIVSVILTVIMYFVINWTFVLIISLISSPFNDLISSRVEQKILNKPEPMSNTVSKAIKKLLATILNELKKISLILVLTVLALSLSLFTVLVPVSIFISAILLAITFLDYSWARNELKFNDCKQDVKSSLLEYSISGGFFLFMMSVPILNIIALPFAVIYFTIMYTNKIHKNKLESI